MIVKMLETRRGSRNGFELRQYFAGETYDLPDTLACTFLNAGYGELVKQTKE